MLEARGFFDLDGLAHGDLFRPDEPVWACLARLPEYLAARFVGGWPLQGRSGLVARPLAILGGEVLEGVELRPTGPKGRTQAWDRGAALPDAAVVMAGVYLADDRVALGPGTVVESGAFIKGPTVVAGRSEVRQGAYLRGDCLVGEGCVVGHTTEVKASVMLDGAQAGHFAYIGDSILGRRVNLGAGTKLANLKMVPGTISVRVEGETHDTGRRKLGAILGDGTETGCNSVTSPGTLVGPETLIYPALVVPAGYHPARSVVQPHKKLVESWVRR